MRRTSLFFTLLTLVLGSGNSNAAEFSIPQVLEMAKAGPEVKAAKALAEEAESKSTSVFRQVYVPKLSASFGYMHLLNDEAIQLPTIPLVPLDKNNLFGTVGLQQVLFDPANMLYQRPAAERMAEASHLIASRQIKETQGRAIDFYLQVLELRAKRKALEKYVTNLKNRQYEIQRIYELGGLGEGDVLKIKLGIDDASQGIRDLQKGENYLADMIGAVLGENRPIIPADLPDEIPDPVVPAEKIEVAKREDILAIDKQLSALDLTRAGQNAEYLPKIYGFYQHNYTNIGLATKSNFDAVGVQASWAIFDGGVNLSNARATAQEGQALESRRSLAVASFAADISNALATLKIKRQEFQERRQDALEAKSVEDSEFRRLKNGKSTVNYMIDAEDELKDRNEKASLSRVNWYQGWFNYQRASGETLAAP